MVSIIESRARGLDLLAHNYYELLYAFHIARHNYRKGEPADIITACSQHVIHNFVTDIHAVCVFSWYSHV